ncbi:MAG: hypothetical protein WCD35_15150, partial [Mycobacteriales bacterium]
MQPSRRQVLVGTLSSALLTACTASPPRRAQRPDPDLALAAAAVAREQALLSAYDEALAAAPALAGELGPLRADHAAH